MAENGIDYQEIGRIISAAGKVENRMAECGAVGCGLREKTESLRSRLSPESVQLSIYIGNIRNRFAHEGEEAKVTADELALFEQAVKVLMHELDKLAPDGSLPEPAGAAPLSRPVEIPDVQPAVNAEFPPMRFLHCSWIPAIHLLFGGELFFQAIRESWEYLVLIVAEVLTLIELIYGILHREFGPLFGAAITLLVLTCLIGIWDKLRRKDYTAVGRYAYFPVANIVYFSCCLAETIRWNLMIASLTLLGSWGGATFFLCHKEWTGAGICAGLSYLTGILAALLCLWRKKRNSTMEEEP